MEVVLFKASRDDARWQNAVSIRTRVFIEEQQVPISEEIDSRDKGDPTCVHVLALVAGIPVATGRIYESAELEGRIGRMAVLADHRGSGAGKAVLEALLKEARRRGYRSVVLDAQVHAVGFYKAYGFCEVGTAFMDCGIPHVTMRSRLA